MASRRLSKDMLDPYIRCFTEDLVSANTAYPAVAASDFAGRRLRAETTRAKWRAGGPEMAFSRDFAIGGVPVRLHRPTLAPALPAMLYIHGGGWTLFSIETHDRLMREYAARAGMVVIGIDYSLAPEHKFPTALEEVTAALEWIVEHSGELDIDPGSMFVGGDSAGANLAVSACIVRREREQSPLAGMVLNYGAFAPEATESYRAYDGPEFFLEVEEMEEFWANYVRDPSDLEHTLVAPLHAELHDLPPAHLTIAECDILADCNRAMADKLAAAGVEVEAMVYDGATHSFLEAMSIAPLASLALNRQAGWIQRIAARAGDGR